MLRIGLLTDRQSVFLGDVVKSIGFKVDSSSTLKLCSNACPLSADAAAGLVGTSRRSAT
jgi:hypothetical protein